jgi:hypothetical protein
VNRFAAIRTNRPPSPEAAEPSAAGVPPARIGKKAVAGYFSPELSRGLHRLALDLDVSLQALMGEAFDDLMRKYGKHPFGER